MSTTQENQREIVFWRTLCLGGAGLYIASKVLSAVFATNNQAKLGRNSKVTPSSGKGGAHRNKVYRCDGGGGHWLDPKSGVIALGPAGGKYTLSADDSGGEGTGKRKENEVVVDCEQYICWRQLKTDFNHDLENEKIRRASLAPSAVKSNTATSSSSSSSSYWVRQQEEKKAAQENLPEGASSDPLRLLSPTGFFAPKSINWENEVDLTSLFFRGIVPVTMSCMVLGKVAAFNCVDSTSIILAGRFLKGLSQMMNHQSDEQRGPSSSKSNNNREKEDSSSSSTPPLSLLLDIPSVAVLKVEDSKELDRRIMQRGVAANFSSDHGGYAWHRQCHVLWQGVASEYSIPLLPTPPLRSSSTKITEGPVSCDPVLSGPPHPSHLLVDRAGDRSLRSKRIQELLDSAQGGHHVCRFYSPELRKSFALIEVLPLQWGLYEEEVILEDEGDDNQKEVSPSPSVVHDLDLVGWYHAEYLPPPVGKKDTTLTSADHQKSGEEEPNQDPIQSLRRECKLALGEVGENDATVLVQSRYVARGWGRETPPYRAMALNPMSRTVTVISPGAGAIKRGDKKKTDQEQGHLISQTYPMAQTGLAGYNSNYLPTFHLNLREEDERLSLHKRISTLTRMGIRENGEGGLGPVRAKRSISPASEERGERNDSKDKKKKCIILYHGSFAPFHAGHKETLVVAKDELIRRGYDVLGAYLVPVAALWPKDTPLGGLRPWALRAAICQMCVADLEQQQYQQEEEGDPRGTKQPFKVAVDHAQGYPNVCVESLLQRIRAHFPEEDEAGGGGGVVELVWVNGTDVGVTGYMEWLLREVPDVTLLWIPRAPSTSNCSSSSPTAPPPPIEQNEDVIQITQALETFARRDLEEEGDGAKGAWYENGRAIVATHHLPTMSLSSTKVRRAIAEKQFSQAAEWIGNDAAAAYAFWAVHEVDDMGRTLPL